MKPPVGLHILRRSSVGIGWNRQVFLAEEETGLAALGIGVEGVKPKVVFSWSDMGFPL